MLLESRLEFVPGVEASDVVAICFSEGIGLGVQAIADVAAGAVLDRFAGEITSRIAQHSLQVRPGLHISDTRFRGISVAWLRSQLPARHGPL